MKRILIISLTLIAILTMTVPAFADTTTIVSDSSVMVYGPLDFYAPPGDPAWGTSMPSTLTWQHPAWPIIEGASWISTSFYIGEDGSIINESSWRWFSKTVELCPGAYDIEGTYTGTGDNAEEIWVNGVFAGSDGFVQEPDDEIEDNLTWSTIKDADFVAEGDTLTFDFIVRNYPSKSKNPESNPTGLIFKVTLNYSCPPIEVPIEFPCCFRPGAVPVAILGSADFDVYDIDPSTIELEGLPVASRGNLLLTKYTDFNGDNFTDLVVKIDDPDGILADCPDPATLTGSLYDGTPFVGFGAMCTKK